MFDREKIHWLRLRYAIALIETVITQSTPSASLQKLLIIHKTKLCKMVCISGTTRGHDVVLSCECDCVFGAVQHVNLV